MLKFIRATLGICLYVVLTLLTYNESLTQTPVPGYEYSYDAAGNRIMREYKIIYIKKAVLEESQSVLDEHEITVYPNPVRSNLEVKVTNLTKDTRTRIQIYDISGRLIYEKESIKETTQIDMSNKTNGAYFMRLSIDGKSTDWKIIKEL